MAFPAPPPLPREHGAWTMLAIPMLLGLAEGGARAGAAWLVPPATVLVFLAHHAIVPWAQRARERKPSPPRYAARRLVWGAAHLTLAVLVFACAVLVARPVARGPFLAIASLASALAAVYAVAAVWGHARSIGFEALGLAGVSLSAPMMAAAAGRPPGRSLFGAAALVFGYFLSSIAYVRAQERVRNERPAAIRACVVAHLALAAMLVAAASFGALPPWWWLAFVPVVVRTAWGLAAPPPNLRALGMREIWIAVTFTAMAAALV